MANLKLADVLNLLENGSEPASDISESTDGIIELPDEDICNKVYEIEKHNKIQTHEKEGENQDETVQKPGEKKSTVCNFDAIKKLPATEFGGINVNDSVNESRDENKKDTETSDPDYIPSTESSSDEETDLNNKSLENDSDKIIEIPSVSQTVKHTQWSAKLEIAAENSTQEGKEPKDVNQYSQNEPKKIHFGPDAAEVLLDEQVPEAEVEMEVETSTGARRKRRDVDVGRRTSEKNKKH